MVTFYQIINFLAKQTYHSLQGHKAIFFLYHCKSCWNRSVRGYIHNYLSKNYYHKVKKLLSPAQVCYCMKAQSSFKLSVYFCEGSVLLATSFITYISDRRIVNLRLSLQLVPAKPLQTVVYTFNVSSGDTTILPEPSINITKSGSIPNKPSSKQL